MSVAWISRNDTALPLLGSGSALSSVWSFNAPTPVPTSSSTHHTLLPSQSYPSATNALFPFNGKRHLTKRGTPNTTLSFADSTLLREEREASGGRCLIQAGLRVLAQRLDPSLRRTGHLLGFRPVVLCFVGAIHTFFLQSCFQSLPA